MEDGEAKLSPAEAAAKHRKISASFARQERHEGRDPRAHLWNGTASGDHRLMADWMQMERNAPGRMTIGAILAYYDLYDAHGLRLNDPTRAR